MSDIKHVLETKISVLTDEMAELSASLERTKERRQIYIELLEEEALGDAVPTSALVAAGLSAVVPKKRGRPPKEGQGQVIQPSAAESVHAPNDQLFEEAVRTLPVAATTSEEQQRAIKRFQSVPRALPERGGVTAGPGKKDLPTKAAAGHTTISVDEDEVK